MPSGPVTARISKSGLDTVDCEAWGDGAAEFLDGLPALLGSDDDATGFAPVEPTIAEAYRRVPHLRLGRTGRVLEALIPAVIEQRVSGMDAWRAWRALATKFGAPAPGPAPGGMRVPPTADVWRRIPSWEFHRANVDPGRARTIVGCAQRADSVERLTADRAHRALRSLPGVGMDRGRNRPTCVRRRRRAVRRRLPPGHGRGAEPAGHADRRRRDARTARAAAAAPAPRGAAAGGQWAGGEPAARCPPGDPQTACAVTQR